MAKSRWRKNFKFFREKNFKNQTELASLLGTTQQTLTNWEKGIGSPKLEKFLEITKLFGISFEEMMENDIENNLALQTKTGQKETPLENGSRIGTSAISQQPLLEKSIHLEEIIQLQKENISSLERRIADKESIESMLIAENGRLKDELKTHKQKK